MVCGVYLYSRLYFLSNFFNYNIIMFYLFRFAKKLKYAKKKSKIAKTYQTISQ